MPVGREGLCQTSCTYAVCSLQIDNATGEVREYGPTSVFKHLPSADLSPARSSSFLSDDPPTSTGNEPRLSLPDGFDDSMLRDAIDAFFTFFNPWCWWVDERRFRQDMNGAAVDPDSIVRRGIRTAHYSPMLHFALLAIGVMYLDHKSCPNREATSEFFARNGAMFFEEEIEATKLSAVVGLLLLGAHHAGHARQSLGYIYAGAGLRLTRILGLGIDTSSWVDKGLISVETKLSRDRVWHTAYIQDKLWSTYVGRAPAPNLSHWCMPFPEVNGEEDAGRLNGNLILGSTSNSWIASTFTWTCKLARIIEIVLANMYVSRASTDILRRS